MLSKRFKIQRRPRIEYILEEGTKLTGGLLRFRYMPTKFSCSRFVTIISGKISKSAVERNTIRRRLYEAIRLNLHQMPKTCYDVVVLVSPRITKATYWDIEKDLLAIIKKLP